MAKEKKIDDNVKTKKSVKEEIITPEQFFANHKLSTVLIGFTVLLILILAGYFTYKFISPHSATSEEWTAVSEETITDVNVLMRNNESDVAIDKLQQSIDSTDNPNVQAEMYYELARVYSYTDESQKQYESLITASRLESDMDDFKLYSSLAPLAYDNGDYEETEQYILIILASLNNKPDDYNLEKRDYNELLEEVRNEINK